MRSHNRNIAVNVWFTHPLKINESDCEGKEWKDRYIPLIRYKLKSNEGARSVSNYLFLIVLCEIFLLKLVSDLKIYRVSRKGKLV